ncbi:hypothetical protein SADUNF_Sadunf04G0015000 [Salix dunnii]|uniref:Bulb-type lectin domain-containing protein n=1 Tax=Salix dunnii TaxID=1413687 RepID=A0A835N2J8_9ROSI|nr:hypothetical protein SADUNF_Sadunf04G0015000 [Salix dunnii]
MDFNKITPDLYAYSVLGILSSNPGAAQFLDFGNLVLVQNESKRFVWKIFDYPTDTMLGNQVGRRVIRLDRFLTSGSSGSGDYTCMHNPTGSPHVFLYKGSVRPVTFL